MKKWSQRTLAVVSSILFVAILVGLNMILTNHNVRFDLTRDKRYSVSPDLQRLLGRMTDVLNVTLFVSPDLPPQLAARQTYAEDLFRELSAAAGGRLRLSVVNMTPDEVQRRQEEFERINLQAIPAQIVDRNQTAFRDIYHHMLVQYADRQQVVMVPDQAEFEFQFGRALVKVINERKPHVVFIDAGKNKGFLQTASAMERNAGLTDLFRVTIVDGTEGRPLGIPADADLVVVAAPDSPLTQRQFYELDQHLMYGGTLLALASGTNYEDQLIFFKNDEDLPNFNELLRHYGVIVEPSLIQDWDSALRAPMRAQQGNMVFQIMAPFPIFPIVERERMNTEYPALKQADRVALALAAPVRARVPAGAGFEVAELMRTTANTDLQTTAPYSFTHPKPTERPTGETRQQTVAIAVSGPFRSYFAGRPIPPREPPNPSNPFDQLRLQAAADREFLPEARPTARLVVIGSSRFAELNHLQALSTIDQVAFVQTITFIQNVIEGLTFGNDLANLRARQVNVNFLRTLTDAEKRRTAMIGTWAVPVFVALFGAGWTMLRRWRLGRVGREFAKGI